MSKAPIKVVVSGAAGNIGYAIVPRLLNGEVFGKTVHLHAMPA